MAYLNIKRKWREQPQYVVPLDTGRKPGACFLGSVPVELIGGQTRSVSVLLDGGSSCGKVRRATVRDDSDTYPVSVPLTNDFTIYLYAYFADASDAFQYLLGLPSSGNAANIGVSCAHDSISGHWGLLIGGALVDSTETLPRNQLTKIVIKRSGTTVKMFRDGVLKTTATNSAAVSAITALVLNSYISSGSFGGGPGTYYALAGVDSSAWSDADALDFCANPWGIFKARTRRVWAVPAANSDGVGSASGSSAVTGIGASIASSVGSSSGLAAASGTGASIVASTGSSSGLASVSGTGASTFASVGSSDGVSTVSGVGTSSTGSSGSASGAASVSGVGASIAASSGSSSGIASASGVGASVAASVGSSDGVATVSGVGDSSIPGSTVGSASGSSSVSGVGASVVASVGSASGSSSAVAVSDNGSLSQGGDDFPGIVIEKRRKKTLAEQPNLHLQSIIDKAAREVLPVARPILKLNKTKELPVKEPVLVPAPEAVISPEVVAAEAEKVAALLAQYHEQVKRMEMEEDEELLLLIMGAF